MPSISDPEFLVIGAGLAGLAAANTLHAAGREVQILEKGDSVGGRVNTDIQEGFVLDRGFQVLLTAYPELPRHLELDQLDLRPFLRGANVWNEESFLEISDTRDSVLGAINAIRTSLLPYRDRAKLIKLVLELRRANSGTMSRGDDRSTREFLVESGFSDRSIEAIWEPLFSGIQLTLSLEGSARLARLILRCLISGAAAVPASGMVAIPNQMARHLPQDSIRLDSGVMEIRGREVLLDNGDAVRARQIVLAVEESSAARILGKATPKFRSQWHAYFSAEEPPNLSKAIHLLPVAHGPCRNVAIMSNVAPEYAPEGEMLLVAAGVASSGVPPLVEVRKQLTKAFGHQVETWRLLKSGHVLEAQPRFEPKAAFRRKMTAQGRGVVVAGDHCTTPSIQGALVSGRLAAQHLLTP